MERTRIIVDPREQESYSFDPALVETVRATLTAGDYSLAGYETRTAVERKSFPDLLATVTRARKRFAAELRKLREMEFACVVVEGTLADVFGGRYRSGAHPASVFGAIVSVIVDFGVPVYFCCDRQIACRFTQDYLLRVHRRLQEAPDAKT